MQIKQIFLVLFWGGLVSLHVLMPWGCLAKEIKILALGDSLIAGYGLDTKEHFTTLLQKQLKNEGLNVRLINAGVSGDTSAGGLTRLEWSLASNPDAVILELGANDGLRGINPSTTKTNLAKILGQLRLKDIPVLFAGMLAPPNLGREYGSKFNKTYQDLAQEFDVVFYPFFLDGVAGVPELNQLDGIHPTGEGIAEIVMRIEPYVKKLLSKIKTSKSDN